MTSRAEIFKSHIELARIIDPENVHHEFVNGGHGRKIDFDLIETGTPLYQEWVSLTAAHIEDVYDNPQALLGVANGTKRLAIDAAKQIGNGIFGLVSEKVSKGSKELFLPEETIDFLKEEKPALVVIVEDVGTTGSNSVQVALQALESGAQKVDVLHTWQRQPRLKLLEESEISYQAIINEELTTYPNEAACRARGFCAENWVLIPRGK